MSIARSPLRHRMPVVFGPTAGPRQGPNGETYDYAEAPRTAAGVRFLTDADALRRLLPPRCELLGDPVVTVEHAELHALAWLAGRSYSILGVRFPVLYRGETEEARGPFLSILWENRPEPILSGREELGFAKLWCELPPPRRLGDRQSWSAVWDGHAFLHLELDGLADAPPPAAPAVDGILHHRYVPRIGGSPAAEIEQMVLSPAGTAIRTERFQAGGGKVEFVRSTWEQLPTMFQIVNALADLPVLEWRGGYRAETVGASDLADQRVLG